MDKINVQDLAFYVIGGGGGAQLVMALLSLNRMIRGAASSCWRSRSRCSPMWIQNQAQMLFLIAAGVGAVIAFLFMVSAAAGR